MKFVRTIFLIFIIFCITNFIAVSAANEIIIDSQMTFDEAIKNTKAPKNIIEQLVLIDVEYYSFDGKLHRGQLVVNKSVKNDIIKIFELIKKEKFSIEKCIPIVKYNWCDDASINANNTSAFCYRKIAGTNRLSNHAFGKAIDINPMQNPYVSSKGTTKRGNKYNPKAPGTLTADSPITKKFLELGWKWGGNYKTIKDWHHFDKK
jgi:hypothetical protein